MTILVARAAHALSILGACALAFGASGDSKKEWDLKPPAPVADEIPNEIEGWKDIACARCHAAVTQEWATSRHALAWVDARYQEQLADMKRPESCHGCHAPEPLALGTVGGVPPQKPKPRDLAAQPADKRELDAHFGVSCSACHLGADGKTILGPFGAQTSAHESKKDALFLAEGANALCVACHATNVGPVIGIARDFAGSKPEKAGRSCVGCHMQPIERAIAAEEGSKPLAPRAGRSHALQTPRDPGFLRRAFEISAESREGSTVVVIRNACGHRVPGLVERNITIAAELLDARGERVAKNELVLDTRNSLAVDGTLEIALAGRGARVKIVGLHEAPGFDAPQTFVDETIELGK